MQQLKSRLAHPLGRGTRTLIERRRGGLTLVVAAAMGATFLTFGCAHESNKGSSRMVSSCALMENCVREASLRCDGHIGDMSWQGDDGSLAGQVLQQHVESTQRTLAYRCAQPSPKEPPRYSVSCTAAEQCLSQARLQCQGNMSHPQWTDSSQGVGGLSPQMGGLSTPQGRVLSLSYQCGAPS